MKFYIRLFVISLLLFSTLLFGGWQIFVRGAEINDEITAMPDYDTEATLPDESGIVEIALKEEKEEEVEIEVKKSELELLVEKSTRVNFVMFAHDGTRADTIMFLSFDPVIKSFDIINIPRDTYWSVEGYTDTAGKQKINAVFGRGNNKGGSAGMKQEIANLLKVPVHYYLKLNYKGAAQVVDAMGGVEINVPFDMEYDDVWAEPELHIKIDAGKQTLDGKNSVDYLRWRKNNGERGAGDLPRIARMQDFMKQSMKKAIGLRLPNVINSVFKFISSDIEANLAVSYAEDAIGMTSNDVASYSLPGKAPIDSNFFISDRIETEELLIGIYSKGLNEEE